MLLFILCEPPLSPGGRNNVRVVDISGEMGEIMEAVANARTEEERYESDWVQLRLLPPVRDEEQDQDLCKSNSTAQSPHTRESQVQSIDQGIARSQRILEAKKRTVFGWPISTSIGLFAEAEPSIEALRELADEAMAPGREAGWNMILERVRLRSAIGFLGTTYFVAMAQMWDERTDTWIDEPSRREVVDLMKISPHFKEPPTWAVCEGFKGEEE